MSTTQEPEEDDSASAVVSLDETDPGDKEWTRLQLPRINIAEKSSVLPTASSRLFMLLYTFRNVKTIFFLFNQSKLNELEK